MKIFTADQVRAADAYTIEHTPITSLRLMEKAATQCTQWLIGRYGAGHSFHIFCGAGNNGGDGLATTRLLQQHGFEAKAYLLHYTDKFSADNRANQAALRGGEAASLIMLQPEDAFPELPTNAIIVDALFGTGISRPLEGLVAQTVQHINALQDQYPIIAIDLPSGLKADESSKDLLTVEARHTLSFEVYKLAFVLPENAARVGEVHILPIGLHRDYLTQTPTRYQVVDMEMIHRIYKPRLPFSHKGTYGHALLIAGSYGKIGAAVLSAQACLHAGVGLLTVYVPECGYNIIQSTVPPAMCLVDDGGQQSVQFHEAVTADGQGKYKTVAIGPGLGTSGDTAKAFEKLLQRYHDPMVIDADALNILGAERYLLEQVPKHSLLTPHPKEFERMFGPSGNDVERLEKLSAAAQQYSLYILLKGRYTAIATPEGQVYFNNTGNAGMATGGSGDVLTGLLAGILAQGYSPEHTMILGVWLHGLAGDLGAAAMSQEALTASGIVRFIGPAYLEIAGAK
ncbi:bifunctional ADP-dependent NAD(P)H-hydrate dehydratase/NAD(P)H-hydrate epimerase [Chitinophaga parva]|uniref:Bifunctional NAD(P)H-hydrate repair enzyme n=1 Tax=Chitinophaga parva TaxID=2169414 RepID=A0A2T7BBL4_9BACT|nr:NAD(P)H-hydrate dehydratase [Chitinophaga parva]PUZ21763.1 bifunctional ADP-dependent NAD(P)H-hydrate dehydratase/NAD(P)H-hydrate epimerase [Chitinophaga parva]